MQAVTIQDLRDVPGGRVLAVDLIDLLRLAEGDVLASSWKCRKVDAYGDLAAELHRVCDAGDQIPGAELMRLAAGVVQVADGDFEAYRPSDSRAWLVIRALDSTEYVVITDDREYLARVRQHFRDVRDSPEDTEYVA